MVKEIIHLLHTADILNLTLSTSFNILYCINYYIVDLKMIIKN